MAKRKTAQELREEARLKLQAARKLEKEEQKKEREEGEKRAAEIGKLILKHRAEGYVGFELSRFREEVEKIIGNGTTEPVQPAAIKAGVPTLERETEEDAA